MGEGLLQGIEVEVDIPRVCALLKGTLDASKVLEGPLPVLVKQLCGNDEGVGKLDQQT